MRGDVGVDVKYAAIYGRLAITVMEVGNSIVVPEESYNIVTCCRVIISTHIRIDTNLVVVKTLMPPGVTKEAVLN